MKPSFRPYSPSDFIAVRGFLVESYAAFDPPHNWMIDRWEFVASLGRVFNGLTAEARNLTRARSRSSSGR